MKKIISIIFAAMSLISFIFLAYKPDDNIARLIVGPVIVIWIIAIFYRYINKYFRYRDKAKQLHDVKKEHQKLVEENTKIQQENLALIDNREALKKQIHSDLKELEEYQTELTASQEELNNFTDEFKAICFELLRKADSPEILNSQLLTLSAHLLSSHSPRTKAAIEDIINIGRFLLEEKKNGRKEITNNQNN